MPRSLPRRAISKNAEIMMNFPIPQLTAKHHSELRGLLLALLNSRPMIV